MEDGVAPDPPEDRTTVGEAEVLDGRELKRQLKENERRWTQEGDSEALWEAEHGLLINLQKAGDVDTLMKRSRMAKRAVSSRGEALELAQASLSLWVLERFDEAMPVLRVAVERLPQNRYPWSLLLRELTWERDPREAIDFILASLDRVPWRGYALVQLGTLSVNAASKCLVTGDLDVCSGQLLSARGYLEQIPTSPDATDEMRRTAERLLTLVDTLENRMKKSSGLEVDSTRLAMGAVDSSSRFEAEMREAAEASGVSLEGEPDSDMNLDELGRITYQETDDDREESFTVLETTPAKGLVRKRKDAE
jgi:tetratricopeptide (TPR) repeat protein